MLFEIPKELNPTLPPIEQIRKDDSNHGIDSGWIKIYVSNHRSGDYGPQNLPRFMWINKSWTLQELHHQVLGYHKNVFVNWYNNKGRSGYYGEAPRYKIPETDEDLSNGGIRELIENQSLETLFKAFFPNLGENNYDDELRKSYFQARHMPYQLKVENVSGYYEDCKFCGRDQSHANCPLPYLNNTTVLDMLDKLGVDDNASFYNENGGRNDFILNVVWHKDVPQDVLRYVTGLRPAARVDEDQTEDDEVVDTYTRKFGEESETLTLDACFAEFKKPELLDEDNKWYCNRCKDHV